MIKQTQWSVLESKFVESPLWSGPALSYGIITLIHYGGSGIFSILMKKKKAEAQRSETICTRSY